MYIPLKTRKAVIQALVLSHLEYCPVIWSSATKIDLHKLQIAQNKAARLALQCSNRTHIAEMHSNLSWLTVENRLHSRTLTFFRNVLFDKKPQYFYDQVVYVRDEHKHMTRQAVSGVLAALKPRTNILKSSIVYRAVTGWNALPRCITNANTKYSFKSKLKEHLMQTIL